MLLAFEYDSYGLQRKPLRASWPKGEQRSTYYLSLPYRYSVPLLLTSAALHWLIPQSFFFVAITPFDKFGKTEASYRVFSCGYSPIAIIFAISLGVLMILSILRLGMRRFKSNIPLAGSCSAAISAACHPLAGKGHELKPVKWGEIQLPLKNNKISIQATGKPVFQSGSSLQTSTRDIDGEESGMNQEPQEGSRIHLLSQMEEGDGDGHAHCSFTSDEVITPRPGRLYA